MTEENREVQYEYDQFIGVYHNAVPAEECDKLINYINHLHDKGLLLDRKTYDQAPTVMKKDLAQDVARAEDFTPEYFGSVTLTEADPSVLLLNEYLVPCIDSYVEEYDCLKEYGLMCAYHKIQKTAIGGGYHVWHCEHGPKKSVNRVLVYTLYLNDVEEGGETEFLYQNKRIPAKKGTICIFPAQFTHLHRGNPPLSNTKYIMTGWIQYADFIA